MENFPIIMLQKCRAFPNFGAQIHCKIVVKKDIHGELVFEGLETACIYPTYRSM